MRTNGISIKDASVTERTAAFMLKFRLANAFFDHVEAEDRQNAIALRKEIFQDEILAKFAALASQNSGLNDWLVEIDGDVRDVPHPCLFIEGDFSITDENDPKIQEAKSILEEISQHEWIAAQNSSFDFSIQ